jgi:RNA-directed DNA polymerase
MTSREELPPGREGEALSARSSDEPPTARTGNEHPGRATTLERVLERPNLVAALERVEKNGGSPGIDGMTTAELRPYLKKNWPAVREALLNGSYQPKPVRRHEIPKDGGGTRELGIPTVLDRFIQQALLQVLQPAFDPTFSAHSYGFRPGRRAHDAVKAAQCYVQAGRGIVVDVDLERFFDRVNHDVLMERLARRLQDRRVLRLIRRYLEAGIMMNGVVMERVEGTPQGGPLSPLLANVLLDEVDKVLERHGHAFVRYADDCNIYVRSQRAGERVMNLLRQLYGKLKLRINEAKSAVAPVSERKFLGFSFWTFRGKVYRGVAKKALEKLKARIRQITWRSRGQSLPVIIEELRSYLLGWKAYFGKADTPRVFADLDGWIRRRLRAYQLKQWKRGPTAYRALRALGAREPLAAEIASGVRRLWWTASKRLHHVLTNAYFDRLRLPRLAK